jgi:hypothetical protein
MKPKNIVLLQGGQMMAQTLNFHYQDLLTITDLEAMALAINLVQKGWYARYYKSNKPGVLPLLIVRRPGYKRKTWMDRCWIKKTEVNKKS